MKIIGKITWFEVNGTKDEPVYLFAVGVGDTIVEVIVDSSDEENIRRIHSAWLRDMSMTVEFEVRDLEDGVFYATTLRQS